MFNLHPGLRGSQNVNVVRSFYLRCLLFISCIVEKNYDMELNTGMLSIQDCADILLYAMEKH